MALRGATPCCHSGHPDGTPGGAGLKEALCAGKRKRRSPGIRRQHQWMPRKREAKPRRLCSRVSSEQGSPDTRDAWQAKSLGTSATRVRQCRSPRSNAGLTASRLIGQQRRRCAGRWRPHSDPPVTPATTSSRPLRAAARDRFAPPVTAQAAGRHATTARMAAYSGSSRRGSRP